MHLKAAKLMWEEQKLAEGLPSLNVAQAGNRVTMLQAARPPHFGCTFDTFKFAHKKLSIEYVVVISRTLTAKVGISDHAGSPKHSNFRGIDSLKFYCTALGIQLSNKPRQAHRLYVLCISPSTHARWAPGELAGQLAPPIA